LGKGNGHRVFLVGCFVAVIFAGFALETGVEVHRWTNEAIEDGLAQAEVPQVAELFLHVPSAKNLRVFENELKESSWLNQMLRPRMQCLNFFMLNDPGDKGLVGREGWYFYKPGVRYLVEPYPSGAGVASAIISFRDQLAKRDIRLLVVPVPGKASVYPGRLAARATGKGEQIHANTRRLIEELRASDVEVVDVFETLRQERSSASLGKLYLSQDTHWSPAGVKLAASVVAKKIRDMGLAPTPAVDYNLKPVSLARLGDVIRMMKSPGIERRVEPEKVLCSQVVRRSSGELYADDVESPILVLGDSFLRIYQYDAPRSAGFISHLAHQLRSPLTSVVNDGGASTLVRRDLLSRPDKLAGKKLVIWEFVERDIRFGKDGWQDVPLPR
jgi:hypothetical protein